MTVLAWIGQILLFFIFWKLLLWGSAKVRATMGSTLFLDLGVNLAVVIVLLVLYSNVHSAWWLMTVTGAAVGVLTGGMTSRLAQRD